MANFAPYPRSYGFVHYRTPAPSAPTAVTATPCDGEVHLAWTPASTATSQKLYIGTTSGGEIYSVPLTATQATYDAAGLVNGQIYYFELTTIVGNVESDPSTEVSATPFSLATPTVTFVSDVTFVTATITNAHANVTYTVYLSQSSGSESLWTDVTIIPETDLDIEIDGLAESQTYYIKIRAVDPCGNVATSIEYTVSTHGQVSTPTFSPDAGTYNNNQTVTISCATGGAAIHYTTDGSTPTSSSTLYSGAITVSASETVKVIGILTGYIDSDVGSSTYTLVASTPSFSVGTGTYNNDQTLTITSATTSAVIHYTTDGSTPTGSSATYSAPLTVGATETVKAIAVKSGYTNSGVQSATYTMVAVTPALDPAGGTYATDQTVSMTSTTSGAVIHYTTDGSTPTSGSTTYSAPITVSSSETIKAIAIKAGYTNSSISSETYTINNDGYYDAVIAASPLYAYYRLGDAGPVAADSGPNGLTGATYVATVTNQAASLINSNGGNLAYSSAGSGYVAFNNTSPAPPGSFTPSLWRGDGSGTNADFSGVWWVKPNNFSAVYAIYADGHPAADSGQLLVGTDTSGHVILVEEGVGIALTSTATISSGTRHMVAVTYDLATGVTKLYIDGSLDSSVVTSWTSSPTNFQSAIGCELFTGSPGKVMNGVVDEAHFHKYKLVDAEIANLWSIGS